MEIRRVGDLEEAAVAAFLEVAPSTVALAGGSTPRPVYERLAMLDYPWSDVDVFFGDERCVPPDHPDSNYAMAHEALLSKIAARAHPMSDCDPGRAERQLAQVFGSGVPSFDLIFLGLGEDGHTASLFPGDPALEITDRLVARVERPDHPRLTFTLPVLSAARNVVFLVSGREKASALEQLRMGGDIPAARVKADSVLVLADDPAASG